MIVNGEDVVKAKFVFGLVLNMLYNKCLLSYQIKRICKLHVSLFKLRGKYCTISSFQIRMVLLIDWVKCLCHSDVVSWVPGGVTVKGLLFNFSDLQIKLFVCLFVLIRITGMCDN